jgi:hypothetical protein
MQFATVARFERAAGLGLIAQCPGCYRIFDCNRSNMHCEVSASGSSRASPSPPRSPLGPAGPATDDN